MVDWNGLFQWTVNHHDGTAHTRPDFEVMSPEDRKWLEGAMQEYTFNDADKLKDFADNLKETTKDGFVQKDGTWQYHLNDLDGLQELIELHERNSLNLAICGGLETVLKFMLQHPDAETRIIAC